VTRSYTPEPFHIITTTTTTQSSYFHSTRGYFDFTYNVQPDPTDTNHWQTIGDYPSASGGERGESTVKGYDEKYNIPEGSEFDAQKKDEEEAEKPKIESERGMSPTMSLVIGIIIGSFTAMILIVIIVLKVRTGVDISETKQEEMQRYQFTSPSMPEKEEFPGHPDTTASTSLIDNNKSNVSNGNGHGIFNGGLTGALNTDRAKLFKKANSYGRPVREWYV